MDIFDNVIKQMSEFRQQLTLLREEFEEFKKSLESVTPLKKPHCKRGHEYTKENTRWRDRNGRSYRVCKICEKMQRSIRDG